MEQIEQELPVISKYLAAAWSFHTTGICVVPATYKKRPIEVWKQYQSERPTDEQVVEWYRHGHTGVGIITGEISGNLEMVEAEGRAVNQGLWDKAREIAEASGLLDLWLKLTEGYCEATPSGGYHLLYRIADGKVPGNVKLASQPGGEQTGKLPLFETRGEGGFVVVAPTDGNIHPEGGEWVMVSGSPATIPTITMEEREIIHSIFQSLDQMPKVEPIEIRNAYHNPNGPLSPGDDFNERATWNEILKPAGWTFGFNLGDEGRWVRPGKTLRQGTGATTNYQGNGKFHVFTTSTIFESERSYSKFAVYAILNHAGDFSSAARELYKNGFGERKQGDLTLVPPLKPFEPDLDPKLLIDETTGEIIESSWQPADLSAYINGTVITPLPGILLREDGIGLLYKGRVHSFYGESESGKSWVAQYAVSEVIEQGQNAIYIDFEADASDIVNRLQLMGAKNENIVKHLTYIKPETRPNEKDPFWQELLERTGTELVIIDGVTESLTIWGGETKDNDSITLWMRQFPKRIATRTGAAVVTIDHVNKSTDTRGRFAIGGQAKLAALDGAAYLIEPLDALAPGKVGKIAMRVTKDRPGGIRKHAVNYRKSDRTQEAAIISMDATGDKLDFYVNEPSTKEEQAEMQFEKIDKTISKILAKHGEMCIKDIQTAYRADGNKVANETIAEHLRNGATAGWLMMREEKPNGKHLYRLADVEAQIG